MSRVTQEFDYYRISSSEGAGRTGSGLRWEFKVRGGAQRYNDLYWKDGFEEPFDKISVWVRNSKRKPIFLALKLIDRDGLDYMPGEPGIAIGNTSDWQRIEFSFDTYRSASWSTEKKHSLDAPIKRIALVVNGLNPGEDYELHFDDLEMTPPKPEGLRILGVEGPEKVNAGDDIVIRMTLTAAAPLRGDYSLVVRMMHDGRLYQTARLEPVIPTRQWRLNEAIAAPVITLHVPSFAAGGTYEVHARLGPTNLVGMTGTAAVASFNVAPRRAGPSPKAGVRKHNGVPTLFINGKPNAAMAYMTYRPEQTTRYRDFGTAGVNLASFSATSDYSLYGLASPTWLAEGVFDYSDFDQRMVAILEANPKAYLFPRVYLAAPPWWLAKHPEEVAAQADKGNTKGDHFDGKAFAWPGSEQWRQDTAIALRRFIAHVRASQYADRVIGYHIASLSTEEWFYPNFWGQPPSYWGYGHSSQLAFRRFLEKKYVNNGALRDAWHDPNVELSTAKVPTQDERSRTDLGFFRDPETSQRVVDFYQYYNETVADTIEYFARVVKDETKNDSLFGVFYGYMFEFSGSPESGHLGLERLLRSPDIDFLAGPSSYGFREIGTGASTFMSLTEAIKFHGKLWFNENDYRTHLMPGEKGSFAYADLKTFDESLSVQRREFAHSISLGTGMWWFDMSGGWYDSPEFMKAIADMNRIAEKSLNFDRSSSAEIAVVIDETSMYYREGRGAFAKKLLYDQRNQLERLGAPYDFVFLNDLENLRPYKLYIFLNTFKLVPSQRASIDKVVKRGGRTAIWVYAPGFVGTSLSDDGISSLTGIKIAHTPEARSLEMRLTEVIDDTTSGIAKNTRWGIGAAASPTFFSVDASAKSLGVIESIGRSGLAIKRFPEWTSVYSATPDLPSWLLRSIAKTAGVHITSERDDVLYTNRAFLAIHTDGAGDRVLRFAKPVSVFEVFDGKQLARDVLELKVSLPARHTALYFLGTEEEWGRVR